MEKVTFHLKKAASGVYVLGGWYLAVMGILGMTPIFLLAKVSILLLLTGLCQKELLIHGFRQAPSSIIKIWQEPSGVWGCQTVDGRCFKGELLGDSYKSSLFMVLRLRSFRRRTRTVFIPRDALSRFEYRLLSQRFFIF